MITWLLKRNKFLKRVFSKIKRDMKELTNQSLINKTLIERNKEDIKELRDMIKVREQVRELTPQITPRTNIEKKIKKRLDNAKLMKAIHSCIKEGYSTNQIKEDIMTRFKIKKTCFFKYLKLVREQIRELTPRTNSKNYS